MRTILKRAHSICLSKRYLHEKIKYIESTFEKVNNFHKYFINQLNRELKQKHTENMNIERHLLVLPYTGIKEEKILINEFYLITLKYALHILELNLVEGSS